MAKKNRRMLPVDAEVINELKRIQARKFLEEGKQLSLGDIVKKEIMKNKTLLNFKIKFDNGGRK